MSRAFCVITTAAAVLLMASRSRADEEELDSRMNHDPELPKAKIAFVYPDNLLPLWLAALQRPEADYQCRAALAIVLGHKEGLKGLEVAIDPLLDALKRLEQPERETVDLSLGQGDGGTESNPNALVRLSVSRALIELDARQSAPQLFEQSLKGDSRLRDLIEPALARWDFRPAGPKWLARLRQTDTNAGDLLLAVRGLAALRVPEAASPLKELVRSEKIDWPMRLEAARALGTIRTSGLESDAGFLLSSDSDLENPQVRNEDKSRMPIAQRDSGSTGARPRLAAAWLLRHHQGEAAVRLLQTLASDSEPAVALIALDRLLEIDSKLVLPALTKSLASPDAGVRMRGIVTLFREATNDRIRLLADRLNDDDPEVRVKARQFLVNLAAKSDLRDTVIHEGSRILAGKNWRGLEQAEILLVLLRHQPAAPRLIELLTFERPEVFVAAGWGLRCLDVPETMPAVLTHFRSFRGLSERNATTAILDNMPPLIVDQQFCHLAQFIGQRRYQPAEATLRLFVPRVPRAALVGQETRAAAIWALGFILEGKVEPGLARQLEERLNDIPRGMDPGEDPRVRRMSAITLARMKSNESLKTLRRFQATARPTLDPVAHACSWAILQITGEVPPPPGIIEFRAGVFKNWLKPIPDSKPKG